MSWKNWPSWLKGGIIGIVLVLLFWLIVFLWAFLYTMGSGQANDPHAMVILIIYGLISLLFAFIIGAIIGGIVGKTKARKQNK